MPRQTLSVRRWEGFLRFVFSGSDRRRVRTPGKGISLFVAGESVPGESRANPAGQGVSVGRVRVADPATRRDASAFFGGCGWLARCGGSPTSPPEGGRFGSPPHRGGGSPPPPGVRVAGWVSGWLVGGWSWGGWCWVVVPGPPRPGLFAACAFLGRSAWGWRVGRVWWVAGCGVVRVGRSSRLVGLPSSAVARPSVRRSSGPRETYIQPLGTANPGGWTLDRSTLLTRGPSSSVGHRGGG